MESKDDTTLKFGRNVKIYTYGARRDDHSGKSILLKYIMYDQPKDASEFDKTYTGGTHGGNPVNPYYPELGNSIENTVILLKRGVNEIPLLQINSIADIRNITIESLDKSINKIKFAKKSSNGYISDDIIRNSSKDGIFDLYDIRTMFVAYRDNYTKLLIITPNNAVLKINFTPLGD